ncbi:Meiotically up-regulated [Pyrenophora seminiperda CCB06]|uniref:Meiotically up-regulated n=1 Tax=Pyrenophora seminiperda CCB06 TaxID=1302712 RepID=A0A3M7MGZ9_9PLEO|nr:Meiotically up-regulated [Pyrenophora seminiperda CCB06]
MVKADPTRNYYADLKVTATASENEIRKAFRTLALQFHPDRNPGRETEFVVRFQEIQAAHEVLCDPVQRAKYDAERKKYRNANISTNTPNTPRTRPPPPSRNTYTTNTPSGSYYRAPPPKPQQQSQRPPPPQHNSTYNTGADSKFTSKTYYTPPTGKRPDTRAKDAEARANVFTAWQKMKQPRGDESRQHNPNAQSNPQNNTQANPNGTPFGRSQSTRASSKQGFDPSTPGVDEGQARSAYRNYARPAPTPPESTTPLYAKESQTDDAPYSEANRVRTPYYSHVAGERTSMFEGIGRSSSVRNSPTHNHRDRGGPSHDAGAYSDSGRRTQAKKPNGSTSVPFMHGYSDSSDEESESEVFTKSRNPPPQTTKPPPSTWTPRGFATPEHKRQTSGANGNMANSFKSRSDESINIKFSPSDWHGKFEGSSSYFAPNMQKGASTKGRTSPTRGRAPQRNAAERSAFTSQPMGQPPVSSFRQTQSHSIPPPPPGPPPGLHFAAPPPGPPPMAAHATTFSPQDWQGTFKDANWVYNEPKETSPRRPSEATKRPKASRKASVQKNGASKTQDQQDASRPKYQAFAEEAANGDADAMDIDPEPPASPEPIKRGSRTAPTSPRPMPNGSAAGGLNGLGEDLLPPLVDPQANGLGGMSNIRDALPFASEASKSHPIKPNAAKGLRYPDVPIAPPPPTKLDLSSADDYFNRMEAYVKSYRKYSAVLTSHFAARSAEMEDLDGHFVHNRGETTKKIGFASYLAKMEEDEGVIETWKVAQERHITALHQCAEVRNKTMKLYQTLQN